MACYSWVRFLGLIWDQTWGAFGGHLIEKTLVGGYAIPIDALHEAYDSFRAGIFGFTFFSLFIASTILLDFEKDDTSEDTAQN